MTALHVPNLRLERGDAVLLGTVLLLTSISSVLFLTTQEPVLVVNPALHLTLANFALVIIAVASVLAWVRYVEGHDEFALFLALAFFALALGNLVAMLTASSESKSAEGILNSGDELAALLLVVGGIRSARGHKMLRPGYIVVIAGVVVIVACVDPIARLITDPRSPGLPPSLTQLPPIVELSTGIMFAAAAWLTRSVWLRDRAVANRFIALALVMAAFAELHSAVYADSTFAEVSSGDVLRLGYAFVLLLAIEVEARGVLATLRRANRDLEDMRAVEVDHAAIEERARLSRELHDGLAQALWLAKLKIVRLSSRPDLSQDARVLAGEAVAAVDLGLSEARQAVMAMHISPSSEVSFETLLDQYVNDHSDRFGIEVTIEHHGATALLPARTQAQLLRIAQEALANIHRHAQASHVTITTDASDVHFGMTITDNGVGFDTRHIAHTNFGLAAMSERAALIGGTIEVISEIGSGTTVRVSAPIEKGQEGR